MVNTINFKDCSNWVLGRNSIHHSSNRYFSIVGVKCNNEERIFIRQNEIGILGFIYTKTKINTYWLIQNKPEPGNINYHQLAPTVQATKSNYERVHGGKTTYYIDHFLDSQKLLINTFGSEQGDRFLNKFNRNCKLEFDSKFEPINNNYFWLSSSELKNKLQESHTINTDARSVISAGFWHLLLKDTINIFFKSSLDISISKSLNKSYSTIREYFLKDAKILLKTINNLYDSKFEIVPLTKMDNYSINDNGIFDKMGNQIISYFDIFFKEREISNWQQPLLLRNELEYCILLFHSFNGTAKFYLKAYPEIGFNDRVELGPTFQTGYGQFKSDVNEVYNQLKTTDIILQIDQTDEGSRFYKNDCRYILGHWLDSPDKLETINGIWLTLGEIEILSSKKEFLTNELRTSISLILSFA